MSIARAMPLGEPLVDPRTGFLTPAWHHYLAEIEALSQRVHGVSESSGASSVAEVETHSNAILAALKG